MGEGAPDPDAPILRLIADERAAEKSRLRELLEAAQRFLIDWLFSQQDTLDSVFARRLRKIAEEVVQLGQSLEEYRRKVARLVKVFDLEEAVGRAWYESLQRQPFGRGRDVIIQSPEGVELAPYRWFVTMDDDKVRPNHWALHGFVARSDWPMWDERYAEPLGYGCRCQTPPISAIEARKLGLVGDFPRGTSFLERRIVTDPRTGKPVLVDPGPDPAYHRLFLDVAA